MLKPIMPYTYLERILSGEITSWDQIPGGDEPYMPCRIVKSIIKMPAHHIAQEWCVRVADVKDLEKMMYERHPALLVPFIMQEIDNIRDYRAKEMLDLVIAYPAFTHGFKEVLEDRVPKAFHYHLTAYHAAHSIMSIPSSEKSRRKTFFEQKVPDHYKDKVKHYCDLILKERLAEQSKAMPESQIKLAPAMPPLMAYSPQQDLRF